MEAVSPTRVLLLPGLGDSGPEHWQSHWERLDPSCERVRQDAWDRPRCNDWRRRLEVASTDDVYVTLDRATDWAVAWGSRLVVVPSAGHINSASGLGAWPEGKKLLDSLR